MALTAHPPTCCHGPVPPWTWWSQVSDPDPILCELKDSLRALPRTALGGMGVRGPREGRPVGLTPQRGGANGVLQPVHPPTTGIRKVQVGTGGSWGGQAGVGGWAETVPRGSLHPSPSCSPHSQDPLGDPAHHPQDPGHQLVSLRGLCADSVLHSWATKNHSELQSPVTNSAKLCPGHCREWSGISGPGAQGWEA